MPFAGRRPLLTWLALAYFVLACLLAIHRGRHYDDFGSQTCDFIAPYSGARCLLHGCDPYDSADLQREYTAAHGDLGALDERHTWHTLIPVYPPSTFLLIAPFTGMDYQPAHWTWLYVGSVLFCVALGLLSALVAAEWRWAFFLLAGVALSNANQDFLFGPGNPSIYAIAFAMLAAWAFFSADLGWIGVVALALALAMKPHMAVALWLVLLLGRRWRRQALASGTIAILLLVAASARLEHTTGLAWLQKFQGAVAGGIAPGGTNEPSPANPAIMHIVNVQAILSLWEPQAKLYNQTAFLLTGLGGLLWVAAWYRTRANIPPLLLVLAGPVCLSMLPIYHRDYDGRLLLLTLPAMVMLLPGHRWLAGCLAACSVPLLFSQTTLHSMHYLHLAHKAQLGPWSTLIFLRQQPASLLLLAFLWPAALWIAGRDRRPDSSSSLLNGECGETGVG